MVSEQLRVLVTNDDGYQARGIRALASALAAYGHEVLVVAPLTDQSGVGTARARVGEPADRDRYGGCRRGHLHRGRRHAGARCHDGSARCFR
ncbi:5'/3'-nucleotidase SurE [Kribbella qitaiheensis]|uniref:5'/3'-nucleotidase SurE n=1 Tax=Kribbella qitaiheensis TaxID=1544730 RepID=UPI0024839F45|nr:5'/3'-nucleotidase SurE [Kribbella qitaiheensis]